MTQNLITQIKSSRKESGLTQEDLSSKTGLPRTTIAKIESGHRNTTLNTLRKLAHAVNLDLKLVKKLASKTSHQFTRKFKTLNNIYVKKNNIINNYNFFKNKFIDHEIWPVLKANAYGHGIKQIAQILKNLNIKYLITDSYFEALQIWEINPKQKVLLLSPTLPQNYQNMNLENLALAIYDLESLQILAKLNQKIKIHLKINTGMNRQGIDIKQINKYIDLIKKSKNIKLEGVFSHLAESQNQNKTLKQIKIFNNLIKILEKNNLNPKYKHLTATTGVKYLKQINSNAIRLGIGLYGFENKNLKPALIFKSKIINILNLEKGDQVSYDFTYTAKKKMRVGLIPVGYYEFFDRKLSNKGFVKYRDQYLPIIGRVCMNLTCIDLKNTQAKLWDEIEIISDQHQDKNSINNFAKLTKTINYEILTKINAITRREVI